MKNTNQANDKLNSYLEHTSLSVYIIDNNTSTISLFNSQNRKDFIENLEISFNEDNKADISGIELINNNPDFFNDVLQDVDESYSVANKEGGELALLLADKIITKANLEKIKELDIASKVDFDIYDTFIHIEYENLENRVNEQGEVESYVIAGSGLDNETIECKYKIEVSGDGFELHIQEEDAHIDEFLKSRVSDLKETYPEKYDEIVYEIKERLADFTFENIHNDFIEECVNNRFVDDNGLANEQMANELFVNRNSIEVEPASLKVIVEEQNGKQIPQLQAEVNFRGNDVDNIGEKFTFKFDLDIEGKKIKADASNIIVNEESVVNNKEALNQLVKHSLPYDTQDKGILHKINKSIGREVYSHFHGYKEGLLNDAGLIKQKKSKSLGMSM